MSISKGAAAHAMGATGICTLLVSWAEGGTGGASGGINGGGINGGINGGEGGGEDCGGTEGRRRFERAPRVRAAASQRERPCSCAGCAAPASARLASARTWAALSGAC